MKNFLRIAPVSQNSRFGKWWQKFGSKQCIRGWRNPLLPVLRNCSKFSDKNTWTIWSQTRNFWSKRTNKATITVISHYPYIFLTKIWSNLNSWRVSSSFIFKKKRKLVQTTKFQLSPIRISWFFLIRLWTYRIIAIQLLK